MHCEVADDGTDFVGAGALQSVTVLYTVTAPQPDEVLVGTVLVVRVVCPSAVVLLPEGALLPVDVDCELLGTDVDRPVVCPALPEGVVEML